MILVFVSSSHFTTTHKIYYIWDYFTCCYLSLVLFGNSVNAQHRKAELVAAKCYTKRHNV